VALQASGLVVAGPDARTGYLAAVPEDCIFCKILAGELPAEVVQEDEHTIAFMDINPWTRGHALVIPRNHSRDLLDVPDEDLARTMAAAKRLAGRMTERLGADGVNLLNACGSAAWQTVFHFHVHVIPRYEDDPLQLPIRPRQADEEELAKVAGELRD
jgi:histidine triad (HIT) family protein